MKLADMTRNERSLLLFFETCVVDHGCLVDPRHMNADDIEIAKRWTESRFAVFGRVKFEDIFKTYSNWVELSDEAMQLAHEERRNRAIRMREARTWRKAGEE